MNQIGLAQLFHAEKNIILNVELDKSVISSYVSDDPPETFGKREYGGYNCLHHWVYHLDLVNRLLDEGADFLKQGTRDGKTPLHCAVNPVDFILVKPLELLPSEIRENDVADTLLSAQIIKNRSENVKCKKGMTHLHIACIVNHQKAVSLFVKVGACVDEQMNKNEDFYIAGYTALHFAFKYSSIDAAKILLENNADIHLSNAKGISPLALLTERLLALKDQMCMGQRVICCEYQREIKILEDIAQSILQTVRTQHVNSVDSTGLSTFHLACSLTDPSDVRKLLTVDNVNLCVFKNSQLWPEWTPLHFAACCSIETFKFLLQNGACINAKNARGETPLDFCIMRFNLEAVYSILSTKIDIKDILMSDGVTKLLDLLLAMHDSDTLDNFLQSLPDVNTSVPVDSLVWPGCNALHLAVKCNEKTKTHEELLGKYYNKLDTLPQVYNCTEHEENEYMKRINVCLARSCSVDAKNTDDMSPIHLAFYMRKKKIVDLLMDKCRDNVADSKSVSILHIACATGRVDVVERLVNEGADVNSRTTDNFECYRRYRIYNKSFVLLAAVNSTPLHLAVIFGHNEIVKLLLSKGADVYAKNVYGLTPIHSSMADCDDRNYTARFFLQLVSNLKESVSNDGLTHLHVAAFADNEKRIDELLQQGSKVNAVFNVQARDLRSKKGHPISELSLLYERYSETTPLYAAVKKACGNATRSLSQNGGALCVEIVKRHSLLRRLMGYYNDFAFSMYFLEILKQDDRVGAIDPSGITLLHIACAIQDLEWAKQLLERGANANAQIAGVYDDDGNLYEHPNAGPSLRVKEWWAGVTPLHVFIDRALWREIPARVVRDFVKLLLDYGLDVTVQHYDGSPLHMAYDVLCPDPTHFYLMNEAGVSKELAETWTYIGDLLLERQEDYSVNPIDCYGFSHFHYACLRSKVDMVKKFLENGVDINHYTDPFIKDDGGSTALHFACKGNSKEVVRLLIQRGADVKAENVQGHTPLHVALSNGVTDIDIFETMLSKGVDINSQSDFCTQRPIDCLLSSNNITMKVLNFILKNGSTIDAIGNIGTSIGCIMTNSKPQDRQVILSKLIKACKIRNAIKNGFNAIESFVAVDQEGELKLGYYLHTIQMFIEMGCEIDRQDGKGKTALHEAVFRYNVQAIEALLLLGANMDLVNNKNVPPFTVELVRPSCFTYANKAAVIAILSKHVWKKKLVGLKVHRSCEEAMEATLNGMGSDFQDRCKKELEKLQQTAICGNLTMRDFLYGTRVVNKYPTMPYMQREGIKDFYKSANRLRRTFPELASLLTLQNKKALERDRLYQPAKQALVEILQVQLPDLCSENVLQHFENEQLLDIIQCAKY